MIALKAAGAIDDDGRRDRENSAGGREKKKERKREAKSAKEGETEREEGERDRKKEKERERRIITRVNEPRTFALFAEFTHYRNILWIPMVRSGPSGSVVHGEPRTEPAGDTRCGNISFTISAFICAWDHHRSTTIAKMGEQ